MCTLAVFTMCNKTSYYVIISRDNTSKVPGGLGCPSGKELYLSINHYVYI